MGRTQKFVKRSTFNVSARALFDWHARPGAFERLGPPWEDTRLLERSGGLEVGARTVVRVKVGPVSRVWSSVHTAYEDGALFRDEQQEGPFARWVHTHRFLPEGPSRSVLEDEVEYELPLGALGSAFGSGTARERLRRLFDYRHAITAADLERHARFAGRERLKVAVTGASGLVGSALVPFLTTGGHEVLRLVRRPAGGPDELAWNPAAGSLDAARLEDVDAVVNLAGAPIAGRWTAARKKEIRDSRVEGTRLLCEALAKLARKPKVLVNASAIGFYGDRGGEPLTEASPPGEGFLADVCREWEAATLPATEAGIRVVVMRIGMVLSPKGGALAALLPPFLAGAGGPIGNGQQYTSWISAEDLVGAIHFALFEDTLRGPVNAVAPVAIPNREFSRALGRVLHRPSFMPLPAPVVRALMGEMGKELLLSGQRVEPAALGAAGFPFLHAAVDDALRFMLGRGPRQNIA